MRLALALFLLALLFCLCVTGPNSSHIEASDGYLVHNLDTGLNYLTIQEALDADETLNGHTILVEAGTFFEHVIITKSISLNGESRDTTVIDGSGTGTVLRISADSTSVNNFTIRNGGHGSSWSSSCLYSEYCRNVWIENNIIMNATNGIIFYGLSDSAMHQNLVQGCGSMGLHLDGSSTNCSIAFNTVMDCLEGIELERCSGNFVIDNVLNRNNASIVFNSCTESNTLRNNNLTSQMYNIIVWGPSIASFVQDIDISNKVNGKTVHYITNAQNATLDPVNCPNAGYIAAANCTGITIKDFNLSSNRDGLLLAQSTNCTISNVTLSGNLGPLLHGGLTFFRSTINQIVNTHVTNSTVAICLYQSDGNLFYHNTFIYNSMQVISDFTSPFSPPSGTRSTAEWDNGLEGNYWSNYIGFDSDNDGIGNTPHVIDTSNTDGHPLMGIFSSFNTSKGKLVEVISNSTIDSFNYFESNSTIRIAVSNSTVSQNHGFCRISIPYEVMSDPFMVTIDGASPTYWNYMLYDNGTNRWIYFEYEHSTREIVIVPEFSPFLIMPLLIIATLPVVMVYKRKQSL